MDLEQILSVLDAAEQRAEKAEASQKRLSAAVERLQPRAVDAEYRAKKAEATAQAYREALERIAAVSPPLHVEGDIAREALRQYSNELK